MLYRRSFLNKRQLVKELRLPLPELEFERLKRMSPGMSRLYELQPDPYDVTQKRCIRICLFTEVKNAADLRMKIREGIVDVSLIRAELVLEPFVLLAAANRAVHQAAHNRLSTRSLSAELIYSLSPSRNISDSLVTFGISEKSESVLACIFDDKDGSKMKDFAKLVEGQAAPLENLSATANRKVILKIYQIAANRVPNEDLSDHILSRLVTKDFVS